MALAEETQNRIGPELAQLRQAAGGWRLRFRPISGPFWGYRVLAPAGGLWQEPARLLGALLGRFYLDLGHAAVAQW